MRTLLFAVAFAGFAMPAFAQNYQAYHYGNTTMYNGDVQGQSYRYGNTSTFNGTINGQPTNCSTYRYGSMQTTNCQ